MKYNDWKCISYQSFYQANYTDISHLLQPELDQITQILKRWFPIKCSFLFIHFENPSVVENIHSLKARIG